MGDARSRVTTTDGTAAAAAGPVAAVATAPDSEGMVSGRAPAGAGAGAAAGGH